MFDDLGKSEAPSRPVMIESDRFDEIFQRDPPLSFSYNIEQHFLFDSATHPLQQTPLCWNSNPNITCNYSFRILTMSRDPFGASGAPKRPEFDQYVGVPYNSTSGDQSYDACVSQPSQPYHLTGEQPLQGYYPFGIQPGAPGPVSS